MRLMGRQKEDYIGGRISESLRLRLNEITRKHGPGDTTMLDDALCALADYVELEGSYRRPMMMTFDEEADAFQRQQVAEGKEPTPMMRSLVGRVRKKIESKAPPAGGDKASRAGHK